MNFFEKLFKNKEKVSEFDLPTLEEAIEKLYGQNTVIEGCEIVKAIYSLDKTKRFLILKSEKGFYKYTYEEIYIYDNDELKYIQGTDNMYPVFWMPKDRSFAISFFSTVEETLSGIYESSEYKMYF